MPPSGTDTNRREIASAACALVAEGGLDSVSMRRIAKHLGATTGYISHYYADKEDLLEAALRTALTDLTAGSEPLSTNLEEWIDNAVRTLPHNVDSQRFWRILTAFQAASLNNPRLAEILHVYVVEQISALTGHLTGKVGTDAPEDEVTALARSLFALVSGLGTTSTITPDAFTPEQLRTIIRSSVYGLLDEFTARHTNP
ncbi:TetR/AcrR family transcriptional regulator [Dietzia aerolata]|uniref:TetR/AcrR family transcriptional regulator n=1 Tax=Dietzia aerolata TaxID=595984 RepID=A0ABV5JNV1_9ACTN|nr:TetR/AcrR family transcriptional regulator [Dietzia aerolata]